MTRIERERLANGLTVLHEEIHDAPVVALQAWVNVGSADEDPSVLGIAHLHEHMLFKGTARRGVGEIARSIEAAGGEINAWTSFDETVYHVVVPADELDNGVDILADALQHSTFDAEELAREREVVLEEIRRAQDAPSRRVSTAMFALAFTEHPYRRPVLGTDSIVRRMERAQMVNFFQAHYRPERVTFVAVGDFAPKALMDSVGRHFGAWQGTGMGPPPERISEPAQSQLRLHVLREDVKEARLAIAWHGPALNSPDVAALDALTTILGHGDSSRLYDALVRRAPVANDAYAYAYTPRDPGLVVVGASAQSANLATALGALLRETYRLRHQPVTDAELQKAKTLLLSESAYQRETVQGQARKLGFFEMVAGSYAFEDSYLAALKALTPSDLLTVASRYLHTEPAVVAQLSAQEDITLDMDSVRKQVHDAYAQQGRTKPKGRVKGALDVTRVELDNGAVILVREEASPVVAMRAVALGGQRWETAQRAGLAALYASVWGLATQDASAAVLAQRVASLGGSIAAFCGRNTVGLRAEFIRETGEQGLRIFCDALLTPAFQAVDFERERNLILERIRNREDNPAGVAFDVFAQQMYPTHPYGLRGLGTLESVGALTLDDVLAYHNLFVGRDKLAVCVVGGLGIEHVIDTLTHALAGPKGSPLPAPMAMDPAPRSAAPVRHTLNRQQSHVIVGGRGVTLHDEARYGLEVLSTVLSGQSGRLFMDLRDKQSLAYSVSSSNLEGLDPGYFLVHMGTSPDKVKQALEGVYGHLARIAKEPVAAAELERAQRYLVGSHAIDLQRTGARAMVMALNELYGMGYDAHTRYPSHIRAVQADGLRDLAAHTLNREGLLEVVVGPATS